MKTIKNALTGELKRVTDDAALYREAGWDYCPKSEWKEANGKGASSKKKKVKNTNEIGKIGKKSSNSDSKHKKSKRGPGEAKLTKVDRS